MQYDTMEYGKQLKALRKQNRETENFATDAEWLCGVRKSDRITPIYTLSTYGYSGGHVCTNGYSTDVGKQGKVYERGGEGGRKYVSGD